MAGPFDMTNDHIIYFYRKILKEVVEDKMVIEQIKLIKQIN